jgi:hypothetical protein
MDLEAIWRLSRPHDSAQDDLETVPFFTWLRMQRAGSRVALYASSPSPASIFVHAVSVPAANLRRPWDELTEWNGSPRHATARESHRHQRHPSSIALRSARMRDNATNVSTEVPMTTMASNA